MHPGEYFLADGEIELSASRPVARIVVRNTGDRPIQAGSHYHFFEVNKALVFDRAASYGMRLDIAAGLTCRFYTGGEKEGPPAGFFSARSVYCPPGLVTAPPLPAPR